MRTNNSQKIALHMLGYALALTSACQTAPRPAPPMPVPVQPIEQLFRLVGSRTLSGVKSADVTDVAVGRSGRVYVVDGGQRRILEYEQNGTLLRRIGGPGRNPGKFTVPWKVTEGPDNTVYVLDIKQSRVHQFDSTGNFEHGISFASTGVTGQDIVIDDSGAMYVGGYRHSTPGDTVRPVVHRMTPDGDVETSFYPLDARTDSFNLKVIAGVALAPGPKGTLYAAQVTDNQVFQFTRDGGVVGTIKGLSRIYREPHKMPIAPTREASEQIKAFLAEWTQLVSIVPGPDNQVMVVFAVHNPVRYAFNIYKDGTLEHEGIGTEARPIAWLLDGRLIFADQHESELSIRTYTSPVAAVGL